jgi:hypothetical protein
MNRSKVAVLKTKKLMPALTARGGAFARHAWRSFAPLKLRELVAAYRSPRAMSHARGAAFANVLLHATGRPQISDQTYKQWLDELVGESRMAAAWDQARDVVRRLYPQHKKNIADLTWPERVAQAPALADVFYITVRALEPAYVIETGVALGSTTSFILAALEHAGVGRLTSIDLPRAGGMEQFGITDEQTGILAPNEFRHRWQFIAGDARFKLPLSYCAIRYLTCSFTIPPIAIVTWHLNLPLPLYIWPRAA